MDSFLHMHCTEREEVTERLHWYEKKLSLVFEAARAVDPGAVLSVVSDHGMTPVVRRFDLAQRIAALRLKMPRDYLAVYDSTMARFWLFNERASASISGCLSSVTCGRILSDDDLRRLGVFFNDRRYGELIFLLRPGWLFSQSNFNGNRWRPRGMHGYDPADSFSDAIFLSNRPPSIPMRTIADVHAWLQDLIGLGDIPASQPQLGVRFAQAGSR